MIIAKKNRGPARPTGTPDEPNVAFHAKEFFGISPDVGDKLGDSLEQRKANATYVEKSVTSATAFQVLTTLKALEQSEERPYFAWEIAKRANVKYTTTRKALRNLEGQKLVFQPYTRGPYSTQSCHIAHHGAGSNIGAYRVLPDMLPRVQNVDFCVGGLVPRGFPDDCYEVGGLGVRIVYGFRYGRVTGRLSCAEGLSYLELKLAFREVGRRISDVLHSSVDPDGILVTNLEWFKDYSGVRIEGVKCLTARTLLGFLERVYNKPYGVRHEFKVQGEFTLPTFYAMVHGGVSAANVTMTNFMLLKEVRSVVAELHEDKAISLTLVPLIKDLYERYVLRQSQPDVLSKLDARLSSVEGTMREVLLRSNGSRLTP